jgi:hypothetical protein
MPETKEFIKNFDGWNKYVKILEKKPDKLFDKNTKRHLFHAREIWYCSVGINIRTELSGYNTDFERPILITKKMGRKFICYPLTSKKPSNELFYYDLSYSNQEDRVESYVLINNPLTLDVARLQRRVKNLSRKKFAQIIEKGKSFI